MDRRTAYRERSLALMYGKGMMVSSRQERQQEKTRIKKKLKNPIVRKLLEREIQRGSGTEVYRFDGIGDEGPTYFDISEMRSWAEANSEIYRLPVDLDRAQELVTSGAVEMDHVMNHTIKNELQPILICAQLAGGDRIVDGAHRFVAFCLGAAALMQEGRAVLNVGIAGYVLQPDQWRPFVIPTSVAKVCGFAD